jgi:hypothetical protein
MEPMSDPAILKETKDLVTVSSLRLPMVSNILCHSRLAYALPRLLCYFLDFWREGGRR